MTRENKMIIQVEEMTSELANKVADKLNRALRSEGRDGDIRVGRISADVSTVDKYGATWFTAYALLLGKIELKLPFTFVANRNGNPKVTAEADVNDIFMTLLKSGKYPTA